MPEERDRQARDQCLDHDHVQHQPAGEPERLRRIGDDVGREDVEADLLARAQKRRDGNLAPVLPQHVFERRLHELAALLELLEHGRFLHACPDVEARDHQGNAQEERNPPAPVEERFVVGECRHDRQRAVGKHHPRRRSELRKACREAARLRVGPFRGHQHRAAPLAADRQTLEDAADGQQDPAPDADRLVRRDQADAHGRRPHHDHREDKQLLPADTVSEVTEDGRADWPRGKADEERRERQHRRHERIGAWKELLWKDRCCGNTVKKEVVPLDRRAHRGRDDRAEAVLAKSLVSRKGRGHGGEV